MAGQSNRHQSALWEQALAFEREYEMQQQNVSQRPVHGTTQQSERWGDEAEGLDWSEYYELKRLQEMARHGDEDRSMPHGDLPDRHLDGLHQGKPVQGQLVAASRPWRCVCGNLNEVRRTRCLCCDELKKRVQVSDKPAEKEMNVPIVDQPGRQNIDRIEEWSEYYELKRLQALATHAEEDRNMSRGDQPVRQLNRINQDLRHSYDMSEADQRSGRGTYSEMDKLSSVSTHDIERVVGHRPSAKRLQPIVTETTVRSPHSHDPRQLRRRQDPICISDASVNDSDGSDSSDSDSSNSDSSDSESDDRDRGKKDSYDPGRREHGIDVRSRSRDQAFDVRSIGQDHAIIKSRGRDHNVDSRSTCQEQDIVQRRSPDQDVIRGRSGFQDLVHGRSQDGEIFRSKIRDRDSDSRSRSRDRDIDVRRVVRVRDIDSRSRNRVQDIGVRGTSRDRHIFQDRNRDSDFRSRSPDRDIDDRRTGRGLNIVKNRNQDRDIDSRSGSRNRDIGVTNRGREREIDSRSRSRDRDIGIRNRGREREIDSRSRSRDRDIDVRNRGRERDIDSRSRSRDRDIDVRNRGRERDIDSRSRSRDWNIPIKGKSRFEDIVEDRSPDQVNSGAAVGQQLRASPHIASQKVINQFPSGSHPVSKSSSQRPSILSPDLPAKGTNSSVLAMTKIKPTKPHPGETRRITIKKGSEGEDEGIQIECGSQGGVIVCAVADNSMASYSGIVVGDQILEFCGMNFHAASKEFAKMLMRSCRDSFETFEMVVQFKPDCLPQGPPSKEAPSTEASRPLKRKATSEGFGLLHPVVSAFKRKATPEAVIPLPQEPSGPKCKTTPKSFTPLPAKSSETKPKASPEAFKPLPPKSSASKQKTLWLPAGSSGPKNKARGAVSKETSSVSPTLPLAKPEKATSRKISIKKNFDAEDIGIQIKRGPQGGIFVSGVTKNSLAEQNHIVAGDQILEFCGLKLESFTKEFAARLLRTKRQKCEIVVQFNSDKSEQSSSVPSIHPPILPGPISTKQSSSVSSIRLPALPGPSSTKQSSSVLSIRLALPGPSSTKKNSSASSFLPHALLVASSTKQSISLSSIPVPGHGSTNSSPIVSKTLDKAKPKKPGLPKSRKIFIKKCSETDTVGMTIERGPQGGMFVSAVAKKGLADKNKIVVGDEILEFCGINFENVTNELARKWMLYSRDTLEMLVQFNPERTKHVTLSSWKCTNLACGTINDPGQMICKKCSGKPAPDKPTPDKPVTNSGPWKCVCGNINDVSNVKCLGCGESKETTKKKQEAKAAEKAIPTNGSALGQPSTHPMTSQPPPAPVWAPQPEGPWQAQPEGSWQPQHEGSWQPQHEGSWQPQHEGFWQPQPEGSWQSQPEVWQPQPEWSWQPQPDTFQRPHATGWPPIPQESWSPQSVQYQPSPARAWTPQPRAYWTPQPDYWPRQAQAFKAPFRPLSSAGVWHPPPKIFIPAQSGDAPKILSYSQQAVPEADKPVQTKLVQDKPVEAKPIQANPVEAKPVQDKPVADGNTWKCVCDKINVAQIQRCIHCTRQKVQKLPIPEAVSPSVAQTTWLVDTLAAIKTNITKVTDAMKGDHKIPPKIDDLLTHIAVFAQDEDGAKFIVKNLPSTTPNVRNEIFKEVCASAHTLIMNPFGHSVVEKFFKMGPAEAQLLSNNGLKSHMYKFSHNEYGSQVIQNCLSLIPMAMQIELIRELDGHVLECIKNQYGSQVILKALECIKPQNLRFIIDAIKKQVFELSTDEYASKVICRIVQHCAVYQRAPIVAEIEEYFDKLVSNEHGRCVIHAVLAYARKEAKPIQKVLDNLDTLCKDVSSMTIVQTCAGYLCASDLAKLLVYFCNKDASHQSKSLTMIQHYTVSSAAQRFIKIATQSEAIALLDQLDQDSVVGREIITVLQPLINKKDADGTETHRSDGAQSKAKHNDDRILTASSSLSLMTMTTEERQLYEVQLMAQKLISGEQQLSQYQPPSKQPSLELSVNLVMPTHGSAVTMGMMPSVALPAAGMAAPLKTSRPKILAASSLPPTIMTTEEIQAYEVQMKAQDLMAEELKFDMASNSSQPSLDELMQTYQKGDDSNLELIDLNKYVVEFLQYQNGSRFIEEKLTDATEVMRTMVFKEVLVSAPTLIKHPFAYSVVQKLLEVCSAHKKLLLAGCLCGHMYEFSLHECASQVIQTALTLVPSTMQLELIHEFDGHVLECIRNQYARHIIQKALECIDPQHLQFIIDAIKNEVVNLSTDGLGCKVILSIIQYCTVQQKRTILAPIFTDFVKVVCDKNGGYIIQALLKYGNKAERASMVQTLRAKLINSGKDKSSNVLNLSTNEHACNVIQHVIQYSAARQKAKIISAINQNLNQFVCDENGIRVIQHVIEYGSEGDKRKTIKKIVHSLGELSKDKCANILKWLKLSHLATHIVEVSQDQHGARFIALKLTDATEDQKSMVCAEVLAALQSLIVHVFGHCVVQKLFEVLSGHEKESLARCLCGHMYELSLNEHASRVIQTALSLIPQTMQIDLIHEFDGHVLECIKNQHASHIIQKAVECIEPQHLQFIVDAIKDQVLDLSTHVHGSKVMQSIIQYWTDAQRLEIFTPILDHFKQVICDENGSRVIQALLQHEGEAVREGIVLQIHSNLVVLRKGKLSKVLSLSTDVHACKVIQTIIQYCSDEQKELIIAKINLHFKTLVFDENGSRIIRSEVEYGSDEDRTKIIKIIMNHKYASVLKLSSHEDGCKVVQSIIQYCTAEQRAPIIGEINQHFSKIVCKESGSYVVQALIKYGSKEDRSEIIKKILDNLAELIKDSSANMSHLSMDYRMTGLPALRLTDLTDYIAEFTQYQLGARFIQEKLTIATPLVRSAVFMEVGLLARPLITHAFGHIVVEKFFKVGSVTEKIALALCLSDHMYELSLHEHASQVIQNSLALIPSAAVQIDLIHELDGHVLECIKNQYATHIIQKALERIEPQHLQFIIDAVKNQVLELSTHVHAYKVIHSIIQYTTADQKAPIIAEVNQHFNSLVCDENGSHVIQYVLELGSEEEKSHIVQQIMDNLDTLSKDKYAKIIIKRYAHLLDASEVSKLHLDDEDEL